MSLAALSGRSQREIIEHCRRVASEIPLIGFYLQPAVGGMELDAAFWEEFARIDNVVAIKVAPFSRYKTLDVLKGVVAAGAVDRIALYTGNDDHIILDLSLPFDIAHEGRVHRLGFRGGLLGHWSVWTRSAVAVLERCKKAKSAAPRRWPFPT